MEWHSRRLTTFGGAVVCLLFALFVPWWRESVFGLTATIGLREAELCAGTTCEAAKLGGTFGKLASVTWYIGLACTLYFAATFGATLLRMPIADRLVRWSFVPGLLWLGLAILLWRSIDAVPPVSATSVGFACAILAGVGGVLGSREPLGEPLETRVLQRARETHEPAVAPTTPSAQRAASSLQNQVFDASRREAPASASFDRAALRFVVKAATIEGEGLSLGGRMLRWSDLVRISARRLPPDPPFEKLLVVDFVPSTGEPARLLVSTKIDYHALPGGAATTARDNLRKLIAHACTHNPQVVVDAETRAFADGGEPPIFGSLRQFASYDTSLAG